MSAYRTASAAKSLPARCAIRFDELPRASQDHLREVSALEHSTAKRERHTRVYAILAATAGLFVLLGASLWSQAATSDRLLFDRRTPWDAGEITTVTGACFVVGVLLLGGVASLLRQRNAPLGTFWYAHSAYLFDCAHDRVVAYPLALLDDQEVVGETVNLSFGAIDLQISFDTPADAGSFLMILRRHAAAAAACLARGAADEIPEADLVPEALLYRADARLPWDRAWALPLFAGAALALAGRLVLPGLHASVAEARLVRVCHESPEDCPEYLVVYPHGAHRDEVDDVFFGWTTSEKRFSEYRAAFPAGRHLSEAMAAASDRGTEALERYRERAPAAKEQGDPRLVEAMLTTLQVLRDAQTTTLHVSLTGEVDRELSPWSREPNGPRSYAKAISDPEIRGLSAIASVSALKELRLALVAAVGGGAIAVHEISRHETTNDSAAVLQVAYRIFKGPRTYQDEVRKKGPYVEIDIDWTLTFRWPKKPELGEVSVTLHTAPPSTVHTFVGSADLAYESLMVDDAKNLGTELRRALGLAPPADVAPE